MADKRYLVRCKTLESSTQSVVAESCEVHGEHLVLLNSKGKLAAMFLLEIVESWSVASLSNCAAERFSSPSGAIQNKLSSQTANRGGCDGQDNIRPAISISK
jgi:hypothetical protein